MAKEYGFQVLLLNDCMHMPWHKGIADNTDTFSIANLDLAI
jgi:hypothetical protein